MFETQSFAINKISNLLFKQLMLFYLLTIHFDSSYPVADFCNTSNINGQDKFDEQRVIN